MPEEFKKTLNAFKDGTNLYVYLNDQKVTVGSAEYQKYMQIYPKVNGRFDTNNPHIKQQKFNIHQIIHKFNSIKFKLPEIIIKPNKNTVQNPFTGGYIRKNGKAHKHLLIIYQVSPDNPNLLIPRDQPTHITYRDKANRHRLTPKDSKKFKELNSSEDHKLIDNVFVKSTAKSTVTQLLNGAVQELKIYHPTNDFALHSSNQTEILNLFRSEMFPLLVEGSTIVVTATIHVRGEQYQYFDTHSFLETTYNNQEELLGQLIQAIAKFDNKIFNSEDYIGYLSHFTILIFPSPDAGGCWYQDMRPLPDPEDPSSILVSYQVAKNSNNCLLVILKRNSPLFVGSKTMFNTLRKKLGLPIGTMIHYKDIERKNMADFFQLTIYVDVNGQMYKFGDYPQSVQIKLRDNHYFHVLRKKQVNRRECLSSFRLNKSVDDSGEEIFDQKVLQPRASSILQENIDPEWILYVNSLDSDFFSTSLTWHYFGQNYHGKINTLIEFILSLEKDLSQKPEEKLFYNTINQKKVPKKLILHCFNGSQHLFALLDSHLEKDFKIKTRNFTKNETVCILNFNNVVCFDLTTIFQTTYTNLLSDSLVNKGVPNEQKEVFDIIQAHFFMTFNIHINNFVSLPGLGEQVWKSMVRFDRGQEIYLPNQEETPFIMQSLRGARNYPLKKNYTSPYYVEALLCDSDDERKKLLHKIKKEKKYLFYLDAFSCYPAAMTKFPFPAGKPTWLSDSELISLNEKLSDLKGKFRFDKIGFYSVAFTPPSKIRTPILLKHDSNRRLVYDLLPGTGVFTHMDFNLAIENGYTIHRIDKALIWNNQCSTYFSDYMKKVIQLKMSSSKIKQRIGKLLMNSLYGRLLYQNKFNKPKTCQTLDELLSYYSTNKIIGHEIKNGKLVVQGIPRVYINSSPIHLASFVLSYSKAIMLDLIKTIDPSLEKLSYYYTDNDSLFIEAKSIDLLARNEKLVNFDNLNWYDQLGKGKNDIKDGVCIIESGFLKPKVYYYTYISDDGEIKHVVKTAGIPRSFVNENKEFIVDTFFGSMEPIKFFNKAGEKTYSPKLWPGMKFVDGEWYPVGFS